MSATRLADAIKDADLVTIPHMGHALNPASLGPLADTFLRHIDTIDESGSGDHEQSP